MACNPQSGDCRPSNERLIRSTLFGYYYFHGARCPTGRMDQRRRSSI